MQMMKLFASLVLALLCLSACSVLDSPKGKGRLATAPVTVPLRVEPMSVAHTPCETAYQEGCLELFVGNYRHNPAHPYMKSLERHVDESDELGRRKQMGAGQFLWGEYVRGKVQAGVARKFVICAYGLRDPSYAGLSAYQFDGKNNPKRWSVADITQKEKRLCPLVNGVAVDRVYRIVAFGSDPIAASFQLPWSMIGGESYILVCSEDKQNVYPNPLSERDAGGLWLYPDQLAYLRDVRKSKRVYMAVLSKY